MFGEYAILQLLAEYFL